MKTLTLAAIRCSLMFTAVTGSLVCVQPAQAYTVTLQQVGANVVATGSGAIDLTGLNFGGTLTNGQALIAASEAQIFTGPTSLTSFDLYTGLSGPRAFGIGFSKFANSGSGDLVGIGAFELLIVPHGYISGTPLSDSMTFNNATFSSLGVTPGTYVWTWGTGLPNQNFTLIIRRAVTSSLGNISARGFVQTGDNVMIGVFIVQGTGSKSVIIRAIGPELGLPPYNIANALANPTLELHDAAGTLIGSNDNWQTTIIGGVITGNQVSDIQNSGHAPTEANESAIIANLAPGNYTAIVRGVNNTTGVALVEVYDLQ